MNKHLLLAGLTGATMMTAWACGSDVEPAPPVTPTSASTTTGGMGGSGGASTTSTTSSSTTSTSTTTSGAGGFADVCEEACYNIEEVCMFPQGACAILPFVDCSDEQSECVSQCIADAECDELSSAVLNGDLPPSLQSCVLPCAGDCLECANNSCSDEISACSGDTACQDFLQDAASCEDQACIEAAAAANPSQATTDLVGCIGTSCSMECAPGQGGAGGSGGSGGSGN